MTRMRTGIQISSIRSADDPLFVKAFALYSRVFPPSEKIDRAYFENLFEEARLDLLAPYAFHFLVAHQNGEVDGFVTGSYLAIVNVGFVGYLAVGPDATGEQIGSRLRDKLIACLQIDAAAAGRPDLLGMMGEVEDGNPWLERMRRRGAFAFDLRYLQPSTGGMSIVPLVLYLEPIKVSRLRSLPVKTVRRLLYAIYRRLYRIPFPLMRAEFQDMLRQLEGRSRIGARRAGVPVSQRKPRTTRSSRRLKAKQHVG
ncbi:MAG: GNAT family N-acetyltransferase [Vicinamibacteria bacterium]